MVTLSIHTSGFFPPLKMICILGWLLSITCTVAESSANQTSFKNFEMRSISHLPQADGETDFKGATAIFDTNERISFLKDYARFASSYFNDPALDRHAVSDEEVTKTLQNIKTQPLPEIRTVQNLDKGWKKAPCPANKELPQSHLRTQSGIVCQDGYVTIPQGRTEIIPFKNLDSSHYELSWKARFPLQVATWHWDKTTLPFPKGTPREWNDYRIQVDEQVKKAVLSMNGSKVAQIDLPENATSQAIEVLADSPLDITDVLLIIYPPNNDNAGVTDGGGVVRTQSLVRPYIARVLLDDHFRNDVPMEQWQTLEYQDDAWKESELPCIQGGFREAGMDLYLRRFVEVPHIPERVLLEVESVDPGGDLYINGRHVVRFDDRDPRFLDITPYVHPGKNLLALKVDSRHVSNLVAHSSFDGAAGWFSGRMRLHLIPGKASIQHAFATTQSLSREKRASQQHHLVFNNVENTPFEGTLEIAYSPWFPEEAEPVAQASFPVRLPENSQTELDFPMVLNKMQLWSPKSPHLYKLHFTLRNNNGKAVDDYVFTQGIRTIAQEAGKLLLNGHPIVLIGAQTMGFRPYPHLDHSAKYNRCAPAEILMRELLAVKNMGGNLLRVHNHVAKDTPDGTGDPRIAEMSDQLGIALFWAVPGWIREGDERNIDVEQMCKHISYLKKHPSILEWEASNHPNRFPKNQGTKRTDDFVKKIVRGILSVDQSRLIAPTTFWSWTDYADDLGTRDKQGNAIQAVPEYTHPMVTRGSQDAITGYGAEWSQLRKWPYGKAKDALDNKIRAWMNFEHEESAAQPNWNLSLGYPWHRVRSYEAPYEKGSIGRELTTDEWKESQAWQAFSAYESMKKQIACGVTVFSWCTIEGGANSGTYEKPLLDPMGHAKLAWHIHKLLTQPIFAGSDNVDVVYGPNDQIVPTIFSEGDSCTVDLSIQVKTLQGTLISSLELKNIFIPAGRQVTRLAPVRPQFPDQGTCVIEYTVTKSSFK